MPVVEGDSLEVLGDMEYAVCGMEAIGGVKNLCGCLSTYHGQVYRPIPARSCPLRLQGAVAMNVTRNPPFRKMLQEQNRGFLS